MTVGVGGISVFIGRCNGNITPAHYPAGVLAECSSKTIIDTSVGSITELSITSSVDLLRYTGWINCYLCGAHCGERGS